MSQAGAVWQWYHAARTTFTDGKPLLLINMDETSVCSFQGYVYGNVVAHEKHEQRPKQNYDRNRQRACMTHACFICNVGRLQRKMPQLIIMNENLCNLTIFHQILEMCPPNVYVKRLQSSWMNEEIMCILLRVLRVHLQDEWDDYHVVLFLDAFKGHIHWNVQLQCNRLSIVLIILPAQLTWLLQPCDTHVFAAYKKYMRRLWAERAIDTEDGHIDILKLLVLIFDVIVDFVQVTDWGFAFREDGYHQNFGSLSTFIMRALQYTEKPELNMNVPAIEDVQLCFPRKAVVHMHLIMKQLVRPMLALPAPVMPAQQVVVVAPPLALAPPSAPLALVNTPHGAPLAPDRTRLFLALAANTEPWLASAKAEKGDRESQTKPPPVTRSQSSQPAQTRVQPLSPSPLQPAAKKRKLPWKTTSPG